MHLGQIPHHNGPSSRCDPFLCSKLLPSDLSPSATTRYRGKVPTFYSFRRNHARNQCHSSNAMARTFPNSAPRTPESVTEAILHVILHPAMASTGIGLYRNGPCGYPCITGGLSERPIQRGLGRRCPQLDSRLQPGSHAVYQVLDRS